MANNKVQLSDGTVLIDTSGVTVTPEVLMDGYTALDKTGALIVGTASSSGGSSWTLLASTEKNASTTSTSATTVTTIRAGSAAWTDAKIIYVRIRDKAGKRSGHFYGSDTFFVNNNKANGTTASCNTAVRFIHRYSGAQWGVYMGTGSTGYGVYAFNISSSGAVTINRRYNSTNSLTIDGTYVIEVYALDYPDGVSPYDA